MTLYHLYYSIQGAIPIYRAKMVTNVWFYKELWFRESLAVKEYYGQESPTDFDSRPLAYFQGEYPEKEIELVLPDWNPGISS